MADRIFKQKLISAINKHEPVVLRTEQKTFFRDIIDVLLFLTKKSEIIIVEFQPRDILNEFELSGGDLEKIHNIHGELQSSLQETEISVYKQIEELKKEKKKFNIVFIVPENLGNSKLEEFGIFFPSFVKRIESKGISLITLVHTSQSAIVLSIVSSSAKKIMSVRKERLIK